MKKVNPHLQIIPAFARKGKDAHTKKWEKRPSFCLDC
jgi:hypothetical protein